MVRSCFARLSALVLLLALGICFEGSCPAADATREMLDLASDSNYHRIGPVRLVVRLESHDPKITTPVEVITALPGGASITQKRTNSATSYRTLLIAGNRLRADTLDVEKRVVLTDLFDGSVWQTYDARRRTFDIRGDQHRASVAPFDPRQLASFTTREPFEALLQLAEITSPPDLNTSNSSNTHFIVAQGATKGRNPFKIYFDPGMHFLPVESFLYFTDGSLIIHNRIKYQLIESRSAHVVERCDTDCYNFGETQVPNLEFISHSTSYIVEEVQLLTEGLELESELCLDSSPAKRIVDFTAPHKSTSPSNQPSQKPSTNSIKLILVLNVMAACLLLVLFYSKGRKPKM